MNKPNEEDGEVTETEIDEEFSRVWKPAVPERYWFVALSPCHIHELTRAVCVALRNGEPTFSGRFWVFIADDVPNERVEKVVGRNVMGGCLVVVFFDAKGADCVSFIYEPKSIYDFANALLIHRDVVAQQMELH